MFWDFSAKRAQPAFGRGLLRSGDIDETSLLTQPSRNLHPREANSMETAIHLLRHGSIQGCEVRRYRGQCDVPMDENGLRQARWWHDRLGPNRFERIYASDLSRTMDMARIVAGDAEIISEPGLREISLGQWEGKTPEEIRQTEPEAYAERGRMIATFRTPGGESFTDLRDRAYPAFARIAERASGETLIVCHSGTIRTILCEILGMPLQNLFRITLDYAGLSLVLRRNEGFSLAALNLTPPA
jgi:alpha-ribazole phosphatase